MEQVREVAIYAYVDAEGRKAYVGQTLCPKKRDYVHRTSPKSYIAKEIATMEFTILEWVSYEEANAAETRYVDDAKLKGECWLNKGKMPRKAIKPLVRGDHQIEWVEGGYIFESYIHAERALGITSGLVSLACRGLRTIPNHTFRIL